jgi:hypothetical protein
MAALYGPYWVEFNSNIGTSGVGTIQLDRSRIWGGDGGYIYRGHMDCRGGLYFGRVAVIRVDPEARSIFGPVERFELKISGRADGNGFTFSGCVIGFETMRVRLRMRTATRLAAE